LIVIGKRLLHRGRPVIAHTTHLTDDQRF
jgi:hypothetical protein